MNKPWISLWTSLVLVCNPKCCIVFTGQQLMSVHLGSNQVVVSEEFGRQQDKSLDTVTTRIQFHLSASFPRCFQDPGHYFTTTIAIYFPGCYSGLYQFINSHYIFKSQCGKTKTQLLESTNNQKLFFFSVFILQEKNQEAIQNLQEKMK